MTSQKNLGPESGLGAIDSAARRAVIVQARMGSSRLPGKVLEKIGTRPLVGLIAARLRHCRLADEIVVATTESQSDDVLAQWCDSVGLKCFRGSVDDVVGRMVGAAEMVAADQVARVWGDCPFVDPRTVDELFLALDTPDIGYASTFVEQRTYPEGLDCEAYRTSVLCRVANELDDPFFRQFPFEGVESVGFARKGVSLAPTQNHISVTVDYPSDLERVRRIFETLEPQFGECFSLKELLACLEKHPQLGTDEMKHARNIEYKEMKAAK